MSDEIVVNEQGGKRSKIAGGIVKILGFSAKEQGGKTTAVNCVLDRVQCETDVIPFAWPLKEMFGKLFVPPDMPWDPDSEDCKSQMLPMGKTVRHGLQWFGTDVCRGADPDCWVRAWKWSVSEAKQSEWPPVLILVPDVRFPNELAAVQEMGGHVIRLLRAPFEDQHESETALDEVERFTWNDKVSKDRVVVWPDLAPEQYGQAFDACIDNRSMSIPEQHKAVLDLVTERRWV